MNLNLIVENTSPFDTERAGARFRAKRQTAVTVDALGMKEISACKVLKVISMTAPREPPMSKPREPVRKIIEPYSRPETVEKTEGPDYQEPPVKRTRARTGGA